MRILLTTFLAAMLSSGAAVAGSDEIKSAMSAGPETLSGKATIMDWQGKDIREGTNDLTLPVHDRGFPVVIEAAARDAKRARDPKEQSLFTKDAAIHLVIIHRDLYELAPCSLCL